MRLHELIDKRWVPGAGLYLAITRRCPLSCDHCSTRSSMHLDESDDAPFLSIVDSFSSSKRPDIVCITGGEPMLRPTLVHSIADRCHLVGAEVSAITGAYFATASQIPPAIDRALRSLDHITVSMDEYHDREVPRARSLGLLDDLLARGQHVSVQLVGSGPDDRYLNDTIDEVRTRFADEVPILVGVVSAIGRGASLEFPRVLAAPVDTSPRACPMLSWPVVSYDGRVVACCNQDVVDGDAPSHLGIGRATSLQWSEIAAWVTDRPMSRAVRLFGSRYLHVRFPPGLVSHSICGTCRQLGDVPAVEEGVDALMARPTMPMVERVALGAMRSDDLPGAMPGFAHLARLDATGQDTASWA